MIARIAAIVLATLALAGCQSSKLLTSIPGGESKVFEAPKYEVRGVTQYDQNWIDSQVEGGVAAFGWPRPAARPADLDKHPAARAKQPVKRPGIFKRIKAKITRKPKADKWPATPVAPVVVEPSLPPEAVKPTKPRDPVDELLYPTEPVPAVRTVR